MIYLNTKFAYTSLFKSKFRFVFAILFFYSAIASSQNIISVSFDNGAIGTQGNNAQDLQNLTNFQTLQISRAYFIQNSSVSIFQIQGNDISGSLRLVTSTNNYVDIPGKMVWSSNGNPKEYMGFLPDPNLSSINLSAYGGSNYVIDNSKNFAVVYNFASVTFTNGANIGGNASSPLTALNDYLSTFNLSRPTGPVTVNSQTTSSTTPTITGTATLANGETLSIEFNGIVYTTGISLSGNNWSWTVPNSVISGLGTYDVVATITNIGGYTLSDNSTGELVVTGVDLSNLGCVTIVSSGGDAEGSTWTYSNNTIMPNSAAAVNVDASVVLAKMALGNLTVAGSCINVNADVNYTNNTNSIKLKASSNIVVAANKAITTNAGDVIFWSDSDASGTTTTAGGTIALLSTSSINTSGGDIVLAGGSDTNTDGIPDGYAIGAYTMSAHGFSPATAGLSLDNASLDAGSGKVIIRGQGTGNSQNFQIGTRLYGGSVKGSDITIEAKGSVRGQSSSNWGLSLEGFSVEGTGDIIVNGWGGSAGAFNADANQVGVEIRRAFDNTSRHSAIKTTGSGTITINGIGGAGTFDDPAVTNPQAVGIRIEANQANPINSANGSITLNGTSGYSGRGSAIIVSSPISSTNGNIILKGNPSTAGTLNLNGNIEINSTLTTGADISLETPGAVTQTAAITADKLALIGSGTFTLTNTLNNVTTIAGGDNTIKLGNTSYVDASGGLTIGTVASKNGLNSTGTISVESLSGDITISQNLNTTNTTSSAITINAGKSSAIGTTTGGNIIISGTPTISTGTGGTAKLFSGSDASSTGLTTLVGGSSNKRNGVDETTSSFSPALSAGTYALYRENIQVTTPDITSFTPEIAGNGETVTITGTGFTGVNVVKFGNVSAKSFVVVSDTEITAVVDNGASGSVYVQNSAGNDTEAGFIFKVVHYQFENNTLDKTDANLDATLVGSATYGPGASGNAICFTNNNVVNGTTVQNYLTLPSDLIKGRGANFTISLRFKTNTFGGILGYQSASVGSGTQWVPILYVQSDGKLSANLWQGSPLNTPLNVLSSSRVDDGNWHKVEFSAAPGSITVYINGVLAGTSTGTIDHLSMSFNQLSAVNTTGVWEGDPIDGWFGFNGCIDEFFIVDKSLTANQIQQVTQLPQPTLGSFTPTTAKSGETVTITGTNLSGTSSVKIGGVDVRSFTVVSVTEIKAIVGKNASVNNTVSVTTAAGTVSSNGFTFSCSSNSLDFDGTNDYVLIGDQIENFDAFTTEAWVYWKGSSQDYSEIYSKDLINSFSITSDNKLHANFGNGTNWGSGINSTTSIPLNKWTHLAITRSASGAVKLYVNGVLDASTVTNTSKGVNAINRAIGVKPTSFGFLGYFTGAIDELRVWNVERTAQQIADNLGTESIGNESGLLAYYNFNQGTAASTNTGLTTLNDLTSSATYIGTLTNMALAGNSSNYILGYWPVIMTQPAATIAVCKDATSGNTISVSALGNDLTYQWYLNTTNSNTGGTAIANANSSTYAIPTGTTGTSYYYVFVSNGCNAGTATSDVVAATVNALPSISYANASYSFLNGEAITTATPTTSGASSFSISPALPAGLSFSTTTGAISGTPTAASAASTYTVTATSSAGCTKTTTFSLDVFNATAPSALTYNPQTQTVRQGQAITNMTPSSSGGVVVSYTISPALPAGLSINPSTGVISGTLTEEMSGSVTYTITATNTGGSTTSEITLVFNTAPSDIALSPESVDENKAIGTTIGTLSSTDADTGDTHIYTLVTGTGSTDNDLFTISGNILKAAEVFDFETKNSYSIRVKVTDAGGLSFEKSFTITVLDVNEAPTDIAISVNSVNENVAANTTIGTLISSDVDASNTFTYTLVSGTGSTDNAAFNISGNNLRITASPNFEAKSSYTVRIRSTDQGGLFYEESFTISVLDVNEAPTDITLSTNVIYEKNAIGAAIGNLSSTDLDSGDKHTYSLVSGDVAAFKISGNQLLANVVYDYGTKSIYDIVVKTTDAGGLTVNKAIRVTILQQPLLLGTANLPRNNISAPVAQNVTISKGYSANLNLSASNIVKYAWSPSTGLSATNIANPVANPTQTTTYTVRITNAQGVSTEVYITVVVLEDYNITPNNVLSPDGDGVNDFWTIENLSTYPNNEVKIFDKAGRIIYSARNYQGTWNGQLNGQILHEGAYYYVINLGPGTRPKVGYITLFSNK